MYIVQLYNNSWVSVGNFEDACDAYYVFDMLLNVKKRVIYIDTQDITRKIILIISNNSEDI